MTSIKLRAYILIWMESYHMELWKLKKVKCQISYLLVQSLFFSSSIYIHLCVCKIEHNIIHVKHILAVNADYFETVHAAVTSSKATFYRTVVQYFEFNVVNAGFTFQRAAPFRKTVSTTSALPLCAAGAFIWFAIQTLSLNMSANRLLCVANGSFSVLPLFALNWPM